jgi:hypothetical protein
MKLHITPRHSSSRKKSTRAESSVVIDPIEFCKVSFVSSPRLETDELVHSVPEENAVRNCAWPGAESIHRVNAEMAKWRGSS